VAGTVPYMSPEQLGLNGASVGRASDVYSLTAVLYEMLTGEPPYGRGMEALSGHYGRFALRPVSGGRQGLPAALDGVLARGLSQDPGQRPPSAGALAREVDALVADEPTRLGAIPVPPSPPRYTPPPSPPPSPPPARRRPVRWPLFIPLAVVVAILVTIGSIEISSFAKGFVIGFENAGHTPSPTTSAGTPPTSAGNGPTSTPTSSGLASRPGRTVYNDDFSGNKGWQLGVNGASNSTLRRGTLGLSVDTVQIYGEKVPVGGSYQGTKVSMDVTRNTATGRAGLACTDSGGTARYAFWVWSDLVSIVRANSSGGTTIGQASLDGGWSSGQQINITAVCYPADGQMGLELLVDNQQVLDTTDGGYTGRSAAPIIVVEGVTNVDVHHLTVTALA